MHGSPKMMLNNVNAAVISEAENVDNSRHVVLAITADGTTPTFRIRVKGSITNDAPNFGGAQTRQNQWEYIMLKDLNDGTTIDGSTGISWAGTGSTRLVEINTNGLKHFVVEVDNHTSGNATVYSRRFTER